MSMREASELSRQIAEAIGLHPSVENAMIPIIDEYLNDTSLRVIHAYSHALRNGCDANAAWECAVEELP